MNRYILSICMLVSFIVLGTNVIKAEDTLRVTAHNKTFIPYYGEYFKWASFPSANKYRKITMIYTLQCPDPNNCTDYDYTQQIFIRAKGGKKDSIPLNVEITRLINPFARDFNKKSSLVYKCDVTDYASLLQDSIYIGCFFSGYPINNEGWLLSLSFEMILGDAPQEAYKVENLWNGYFPYGIRGSQGDTIEHFLNPRKIKIDSNAHSTIIRITPSGHGFQGPENCAEFCKKTYNFLVNRQLIDQREIWREDCGLNPFYPGAGVQAFGTWLYDRANWCPGLLVKPFDHNISSLVSKGDSVTLDINMQTGIAGNNTGYYFHCQAISYHPPSHTINASIDEILKPSSDFDYNRFNPICSDPSVMLKNNGTEALLNCTIVYGMNGNYTDTFRWMGNLPFLQREEVILPNSSKIDYKTSGQFVVKVINPNGGIDENPNDDALFSNYKNVPQVSSQISIDFTTNRRPGENEYWIFNDKNEIVHNKNDFEVETYHRDTVSLAPGCYRFELQDYDKDGLSFFANTQTDGGGSIRLYDVINKKSIKLFNANFGTSLHFAFIVKDSLSFIDELTPSFELKLYPNPASKQVILDIEGDIEYNRIIQIFNAQGQNIKSLNVQNSIEPVIISLKDIAKGIYFVRVIQKNGMKVERLVVE